MTDTKQTKSKYLEILRSQKFNNSFYERYTGKPVTSIPRVNQVNKSAEPFAVYILSLLDSEHWKMLSSKKLHKMLPDKYRPLIETMVDFGLIEIKKSIRIDHPKYIREALGLDDEDVPYRKKRKLINEFMDQLTISERIDYIGDYSVQTEFYQPISEHKDGKHGTPKSYRLGFQGRFYNLTSADEDYTLSETVVKRIAKAYEANYEDNNVLDSIRESIQQVKCTATEDEINDYVSEDVEDENGDKMDAESQKYWMMKNINGERKAWQKGDYNTRIMNTLLFAPSKFRADKLVTDSGEKMVGSDISNAIPFFLIEKFLKDNPVYNDVDNYFKYVNLHDCISQGRFYQDIASSLGVVKDVVKQPMMQVINKNQNHELKKGSWAFKIEKYLQERYPEFYDFIRQLNTEKGLIKHYGYQLGTMLAWKTIYVEDVRKRVWKSEKIDGVKKTEKKWVKKQVYKPNRAISLMYAKWETDYILECANRIHKEVGDIAMYTTYDAIYVGKSHQPKVQQIMEQAAKERFLKPLTIKAEN